MLQISAQQNSGRLDGSQCGLCHQHSIELILGMQLGDCVPSGLVCRRGVLQIPKKETFKISPWTVFRYEGTRKNLKDVTLHVGRLIHLAI